MYEIYKVTNVTSATTKYGDICYHVQINGSILIKVYPQVKWKNTWRTVEWNTKTGRITRVKERNKELYYSVFHSFWEQNNESLLNLTGKYIVTTSDNLKANLKNGYNVQSVDLVHDFKKLLDDANGRTFSTGLPIYNFLKKLNYTVNQDNSITLRKEYSGYNVNTDNLCYQNTNKPNILTFENIGIIYDHFFRGKGKTDDGRRHSTSEYKLNKYSIFQHWSNCGSYKRRETSGTSYVMVIGDDLKDEHIQFLAEIANKQ